MNKTLKFGIIAQLKILARPTAVTGFLLLWLIFSFVGWLGLDMGVGTAVLTALIATLLHFLGEFWHQLGHAWAARRAGWPMSGVMFIWVVAASLYPKDEPKLPARVHIKRALGGPAASLVMAFVMGLIVWGTSTGSVTTKESLTAINYLAWFFFLDNLLVFTLGGFLPLGFTDGSTLLHYWPQRKVDN